VAKKKSRLLPLLPLLLLLPPRLLLPLPLRLLTLLLLLLPRLPRLLPLLNPRRSNSSAQAKKATRKGGFFYACCRACDLQAQQLGLRLI